VLAVLVGLGVYAGVDAGTSGARTAAKAAAQGSSPARRVRELTSLRTATSDTFQLSDGTRELVGYDHAVNFRGAAGGWQPIDTSLVEAADGSWQPVASSVPFSLPSSLAGEPVSIGTGSTQLSFSLEGAGPSEGAASGAKGRTYPDVMPGVSVSYGAVLNGVHEVLTLADASTPSVYTYKLSYGADLHASLAAGGGVVFRDPSGKTVYMLAAPAVSDSSSVGQRPASAPIHYQLSADGSVLSLVLEKAWLSDPKRVFPVKVDPDVYYGEAADCTIASASYANTSLCSGRLYVGANSETPHSVGRALLRFDLSCIPHDSVILNSGLKLWFEGVKDSKGTVEVEAFPLSRNFTDGATWNTYDGTHSWTTPGGDFSSSVAGRQTMLPEWASGWVTVGFSPLVEQWVQHPSSNDGILLKAHSESTVGYDSFVQTDNGEGLGEPNMDIVYAPRTGISEGDIVLGDELAGGAEAAVNAANGNLLVSNPDVDYEGEGYETKLSRYYNSMDEDMAGSSFGAGWLLSMGNDTLLYPNWWDGSYTFHAPTDGVSRFDPAPPASGTEAPDDISYTAPNGSEATLAVHEDGTRTMTFPETGAEWKFDNSGAGFPQKIIETEGASNTISLGYHESELSHLADSHGDELTIPRNHSTGHVTKIEGSGGKTWTYSYNASHQLSEYENPTKEKTTYTYNSNGLLGKIQDASGTYVISYESSDPHRVLSLRHLVNGTVTEVGSEDEITSYEYKTPESPTCNPTTDAAETTVTYSPGGATENYCFNAEDHVTGPKSASEKEAEESPETTETQEEVAAGTCFDEASEWNDCELEEAPPEPEEDLKAENYGIADNNWLISEKQHEEEQKEVIPPPLFTNFNYFGNPYFQALKVHYLRRTMPWNTVLEAKLDEENPEHENAKKEKVPGFDPGARARRNDTEHWAEEAKASGAQPIISFERCPKGAKWTNPVFEAEREEAKRAREREAKEHKPAPEATTLEEHAEKVESCETPPRRKSYEYAVKLFEERTAFAGITHLTAWSEPNNPYQSMYAHPEIAGQLWRVMDDLCIKRHKENSAVPECHVAAGDFADSFMRNADEKTSKGGKYFRAYVHGTGRPTTLYKWAWHAYRDGVETQAPKKRSQPKTWWTAFKSFRAAVDATVAHPRCGTCEKPKIWLAEQGVVLFEEVAGAPKAVGPEIGRTKTGVPVYEPLWTHWNLAEGVMNAYVNKPAKNHEYQLSDQKQVSLFMYYQMLGNPNKFDSGLLETNVTPLPEKLKARTTAEKPREKLYSIYKTKTLKGG
jgi:YD repeat-containing protein